MTYTAPVWLPEGHSQTLYPALFLRQPRPVYRRECWDTPDGGQIALDWVEAPQPDAPLLVVLHGLEGSSRSHYARALMAGAQQYGWQGVVVHFRGCGGVANTLPRAYHAGDSAELGWVLPRLLTRSPRLYGVGVSLGGNLLLKYLGETGQAALLQAAVAISAPLDLTAASQALDSGFNRQVYTRLFLSTLKQHALHTLHHHPTLFDRQQVLDSRTFAAFDRTVTAPLAGYASAEAYWQAASAKPWLPHIVCPTLVLNAQNDPFLPAHALPLPHQASPAVTLEFPATGGHVGFVTGRFPGTLAWLPARVFRFFAATVNPA